MRGPNMRIFDTLFFVLGAFLLGGQLIDAQAPTQAKPKDVDVVNFKIRVADEESSQDWESISFENVAYPSGKVVSSLSANDYQRIQISFGIFERGAKTAFAPHQVFVRFVSADKEVVLFPELDAKTGNYRLDADLKTKVKQFDNFGGKYALSLIVGDAKINSFIWQLGDVQLSFSQPPSNVEDYYAVKPEIVHMFRQPENRPPEFVSNVFCLVIAGLFVVMLLLWMRVGISFSGMTVSSLLFQLSLGLLFYIELMFFVGNDMFTTLRYMTWAGPFALFFGRRMLSHLSKIEDS